METMTSYAGAGFQSQKDVQVFLDGHSRKLQTVVTDYKGVVNGHRYDTAGTTWLLAKQTKEAIEAVGVSMDDLASLQNPLVCEFIVAYKALALRFAPMTYVDSSHEEVGAHHVHRRKIA